MSSAEDSGNIPKGMSEEEYEVIIFFCPQCGAEIMSDDVTAKSPGMQIGDFFGQKSNRRKVFASSLSKSMQKLFSDFKRSSKHC